MINEFSPHGTSDILVLAAIINRLTCHHKLNIMLYIRSISSASFENFWKMDEVGHETSVEWNIFYLSFKSGF